MTEQTTVFKQGDLVRTTKITDNLAFNPARDPSPQPSLYPKGFEFVVEEFVTAGHPEEGEIDVNFYYGSANGGMNNITVMATDVELVKTAAEQAARKKPTQQEAAEYVANALLHGNGFTIFETQPFVDGEIEAYGHTDEGLAFGFRVQVSPTWRTDD
jgi:hypothetical protein